MADRYVDYIPLDQVQGAHRNPKGHYTAGIRMSINRHGLGELPLLDERTGRLVAGHGRHDQITAMHAAGETPPDGVQLADDGTWLIPVIRGWASRSDDEAEAYLVASNQLTTKGGWDEPGLAELLQDLADKELLELTGFDADDLARMLESLDTDLTDGGEAGGSGAAGEARKSLAERFGVPPFTILDTKQGYWHDRKRSWIALGLRSEDGREGDLIGGLANAVKIKVGAACEEEGASEGWESGTSIFDPVLCEVLIRWYSAPTARVLDPFAGGSVRGIVSGYLGRAYTGIDLRADQVAANEQQAHKVLTHVPAPIAVRDYTPPLTPIEEHGGYLVKRDDAWTRTDTEEHPEWFAAPFGMGLDAYADNVAEQVANIPDDVHRIVVPCGSGMTAAGILRGLHRADRQGVRLVAVSLGHEPVEYLDQFAPPDWRDQVDLVASNLDFDTDAPVTTLGGLHLDPMYEAKCLPFLQPGDLLWCVGIRHTAPTNPTPGSEPASAPMPQWLVGDSRNLRDLIPADDAGFDLMLTCPPYFDLEVYSDDPADLSQCQDYPAFLTDYTACLAAATDRMAPDAFAAIVTGALRDKRGYVLDLPSDTTRIMESLGWRLYQDAVLANQVGTAALRATRNFALRKLTRVHQMVGVYHRGNISQVREWPPCEVGEITPAEEVQEP